MHTNETESGSRPEPLSSHDSAAEIARIRENQLLGRAGRLSDLFDYLLERSLNDEPPKEVEIIADVFSARGAPAQDDAVARVYVHRLRKRLDEIATKSGSEAPVRLSIPLGEYRLVAERVNPEPGTPANPDLRSIVRVAMEWTSRRRALVAAGALCCVLLLGNVIAWSRLAGPGAAASEDTVARAAIWSPIATGERPLLLVVGDYYMFGEYEDRLFLTRLIRDFSINSKQDLVESYLTTPEAFDRYGDVALQYLPTSVAYALADIAPVLADREVRVALASELTETQLRDNDILYLGLISGLGRLKGPVFTASRFSIGESYDIISDTDADRTYTSEAFVSAPSDAMYRDYGLYKSFSGPSGNQIVVLAGARDTALMGLAEALVSEKAQDELAAAGAPPRETEALFEVQGHKHINLRARLLSAGAVESAEVWSSSPADMPVFPAQ